MLSGMLTEICSPLLTVDSDRSDRCVCTAAAVTDRTKLELSQQRLSVYYEDMLVIISLACRSSTITHEQRAYCTN